MLTGSFVLHGLIAEAAGIYAPGETLDPACAPGSTNCTVNDVTIADYFVGTTTATSTFAGGLQSTALYITSSSASSTFANGINLTGGCYAINGVCLSSGISSLNGLTSLTQLFATSSDTNIGLNIVSSGGTHTFTPTWSGTLAPIRGGTGLSSITNNQLLIGGAGNTVTQVATSSLGLLTTNVAEGSNQYFTNTRAQNAITNSVTGLTYTGGTFSLTSGYTIPLSASTTEWNAFYNSPSTRITAGTGLSWSGNTLNATGGGSSASSTLLSDSNTFSGANNFTGNLGVGTSSPYAKLSVAGQVVGAYFTGTTTSTSTLAGGLQTLALNVTGSASSTFTNGINLSNGCFSVNGTCISGGGGGSGTVSSGTTGQTAFYNADGTVLTATSSIFLTPSGSVGIGTTNPLGTLDVQGQDGGTVRIKSVSNTSAAAVQFLGTNSAGLSLIGQSGGAGTLHNSAISGDMVINNRAGGGILLSSDSGYSRTDMYITSGGNVGIGTSSPANKLSVGGTAYIGGNLTATGTATIGTLTGLLSGTNGVVSAVATSSLGINTNDITEGSNLFYTAARDIKFSTTSADYWESTQSRWATTSSDYWLTTKSTSNLTEGSNQYFTNARAQNAITNSVTGLTYSGGSFSLTSGYLIPLSASTTNWNGFYDTPSSRITAGTGLSWSGNTLNASGLAASSTLLSDSNTFNGTSTFRYNLGIGGAYDQYGATTVGIAGYYSDLESNNGIVHIDSINSEQVGVGGSIALGGKAETHTYTFGGIAGVKENSSSGDNAGALLFYSRPSAALPLERLRISSTGNVGIGTSSPYAKLSVVGQIVGASFVGTTTATSTLAGGLDILALNVTGSASSTFNNGINLSGGCYAVSGTCLTPLTNSVTGLTYSGGALSLTSGYTIPLSASTTNWNGFYDTPSSRITAGTGLSWSGNTLNASGVAASSTLLSDTNTWSGTNNFAGNLGVGTSSPYAKLSVAGQIVGAYFTGTTTATSTLAGGLQALALNITGSASSTFTNGINLAAGCFSVNGTCLSTSAGGSGTVGSGTTGQFAFYNGAGTTLTATSSIFLSQAGSLGVGTTSILAKLHVFANDATSAVGSGGTISAYTSGGQVYKVHVFTSDGTFTAPTTGATNVQVLVVAGGGGGGAGSGGGGGAGGVVASSTYNVTPGGTYTVTVGAGGSGGTGGATPTRGNTGSNSVFGSLTANGGGYGGGGGNAAVVGGANGGSGGGSGGGGASVTTGGTGSQGSNGGANVFTANCYGSGGGGGNTTVGAAGTGSGSGNGGTGTTSSITGASVTYAGGGGGGIYNGGGCSAGSGGSGGGGTGASTNAAGSNGTANTGGGGGGGWRSADGATNTAGGDGGSGIVIVTYLADSGLAGIFENGNVGIGTTTPSAQLTTTGSVRFATFGAGSLQTDANGNLSVSSDERLKTIVSSFATSTSVLEKLTHLNGIIYKWNEASGLDQVNEYVGFTAQNVESYFPQLVGQNPNGYKSLNYAALTVPLVESIKELSSNSILNIGLATTSTSTSTPVLRSLRLDSIEERLANLEATTTQSQILTSVLQNVKEWVVEKITATYGFFAHLTVGSAQNPAGITLYSKAGKPFCLTISDDGSPQSVSGECSSATSTPVSIEDTETEATSTPALILEAGGDEATSTPSSISTTTIATSTSTSTLPSVSTTTPVTSTSTPSIASSTPEVASSTPVVTSPATSTPPIPEEVSSQPIQGALTTSASD